MEHIWLDRAGQAKPEDVKLFDKVQYDGAGFFDYLGRLDLSAETLLHLLKQTQLKEDGPQKQATEDYPNSVVQEWLFVAVITEFFVALGLTVPRDSLIRTEASQRYLTTHHLAEIATAAFANAVLETDHETLMDAYLSASVEQRISVEQLVYAHTWQHRKAAKGLWAPQKKQAVTTVIEDILSNALAFLQVSCPMNNCLDLSTWAACQILNDSLRGLFFCLFGLDLELTAIRRNDPIELWTSVGLDRQLCPFRTYKMYTAATVTDAYIAASLLPLRTQDHTSCSTYEYCRATTVLNECPTHRADCDRSCAMLTLTARDMLVLDDSLSTGHWGILRFKNDSPDSCDFYMESSSACPTQFVAFSHVWSHGLGNSKANALWSCQILFLKQVMSRAGCTGMGFWLDPLCVPLNSDLKMRAIAQMTQIYTAAAKTIVLDYSLEHQGGSNAHKIAHILISDWLTRIWTLQEALLPKEKLHFLFRDSIDSITALTKHPTSFTEFTMSSALVNVTWRNELIKTLRLGSDQSLMSLVESFHLRSTTRQEDEPICLAILCGIPTHSLPDRPELHHVIGLMDTIPQDLLYAIGPRSTAPGFGWLPASFISKNATKTYEGQQILVPRDARGICMYKAIARVAGSFTFDPTFETTHERHFQLFADSGDAQPYRIATLDSATMSLPKDARTRTLNKAALVFERSLDNDISSAVLVSGLHLSQDDDLHASYEARLYAVGLKTFFLDNDDASEYTYTRLTAPVEPETRIWIS